VEYKGFETKLHKNFGFAKKNVILMLAGSLMPIWVGGRGWSKYEQRSNFRN
jgi:hypothetical protein